MWFNVSEYINISMLLEVRKRTLPCYIWTILTIFCELRTIDKMQQQTRYLKASETRLYRKMLKMPWTDNMINKDVLSQAEAQRQLFTNLKKRQSPFIGHVMRKETHDRYVDRKIVEES